MNKVIDNLRTIANQEGYDLWYDRHIHLWTCTSMHGATEYFAPAAIKSIKTSVFREILVSNYNEGRS